LDENYIKTVWQVTRDLTKGKESPYLVFKVFQWWNQHSKAFTPFFAGVFMVHFVCTSNGFGITVISIPEQFKPLVNEYVVDKKIGESVSENSQSNWQSIPKIKIFPRQKKTNTYGGIKKKEKIVAFPPAVVVFFVVVFM